jgi:hypothetical protein
MSLTETNNGATIRGDTSHAQQSNARLRVLNLTSIGHPANYFKCIAHRRRGVAFLTKTKVNLEKGWVSLT